MLLYLDSYQFASCTVLAVKCNLRLRLSVIYIFVWSKTARSDYWQFIIITNSNFN